MAASTIPPATLASARELQRYRVIRTAGGLLDQWHLLSLDAPTVAVVWTASFAAALHLRLPALGLTMLALAAWLLYVADRLLDVASPSHAHALQPRHYFHQRHRKFFLTVTAAILPLLAWLVGTRLDPAPLREDLVLAGCSLLYLICVHLPLRRGAGRGIPFPKELIVGVIFATACVIPTWSRLPLARAALLLPLCLFAGLCWINCVAIEYWESTPATRLHRSTHWIGRHFIAVTGMAAAIAAAAVPFLFTIGEHASFALAAIYLSIAVSSGALAWLHQQRHALNALRLRAAADAVLLTPAILIPACLFLQQHLHQA